MNDVTPEDKLVAAVDAFNRTDKTYHRSLAKPLTLKVLSKKQRKTLVGVTAAIMKSINSKQAEQFTFSDGTAYVGLPARFMDVGMGLGFQKMGAGIPFVKVVVA